MAEPSDQHEKATKELTAAQEEANSVKVTLADLSARGTAQYAHKNYEEAADLYAQASELQAELNGEMNPENAEILFLYGRALFKVGQSKSDVLGGRVGGDSKKSNGSAKSKKTKSEQTEKLVLDNVAEEGAAIAAKENDSAAKLEEDNGIKKPLFQFTGDENFEDSDDDADGEGEDGAEAEEEEDDLASAFEVLDLARVLFAKRLEQPEHEEDKGKSVGDSPMTKHIKERLGDTHDLLAEISLENERFPAAVSDFRAALGYKTELYPFETEIIAEAHYKLSLALEFASITRVKEEGEEEVKDDAEAHVDQAMRDEAAKELEAALESTKAKLYNREVELASTSSPDENDITRAQITEVKEIIADMEGRLAELKASPVMNLKDQLYGGTQSEGILGASAGETPAAAQARIEEAKKTATDLTGLVRRKKNPKASETSTPEPSTQGGNGKRKAEDDGGDSDSAKKTKVEDADES